MNTTQDISPKERAKWQVPAMEIPLWLGKQHPYCVVIPVINEGERIKSLLKRMEAERISSIADIIIVDGGSTDGSLELDSLQQVGVRGLVVKKGPGKLSTQLRCAYAFALDQGYQGIVTIDGNDKDDPDGDGDLVLDEVYGGRDACGLGREVGGADRRAKIHEAAQADHGGGGWLAHADRDHQREQGDQEQHGEAGRAGDGDVQQLPEDVTGGEQDVGGLEDGQRFDAQADHGAGGADVIHVFGKTGGGHDDQPNAGDLGGQRVFDEGKDVKTRPADAL